MSLPCDTGCFGLLVCIEVMEVLSSDWFPDEAELVPKPGGLMVGVSRNRQFWRGHCHNTLAALSGTGAGQYYRLANAQRRGRTRVQGFNIADEQGICWPPFTRNSDSRLVPVIVPFERILGLSRLPRVSPWIVFVARKVRMCGSAKM